jgi:hypothetical protein
MALRVSFPKNVARARRSNGMTETIISDPIAGELRRIDAFSHGRALTVEGREVQAVVETGEGLTPEALAQARRLVSQPDHFAQRARLHAAESLCELKNETWAGEDPPLSASQLALALSLEACEIGADGVATLYFADGGLFGGHSAVVYLDPDGNFSDAKLAG